MSSNTASCKDTQVPCTPDSQSVPTPTTKTSGQSSSEETVLDAEVDISGQTKVPESCSDQPHSETAQDENKEVSFILKSCFLTCTKSRDIALNSAFSSDASKCREGRMRTNR